VGFSSEVGLQAGDVKNSVASIVSEIKSIPWRVMNVKTLKIKIIAETPPTKTIK
jgi:hypothetical protein